MSVRRAAVDKWSVHLLVRRRSHWNGNKDPGRPKAEDGGGEGAQHKEAIYRGADIQRGKVIMAMSITGDLYGAVRQLRICQRFGRLCGLSP
jgi:hypothetical protein